MSSGHIGGFGGGFVGGFWESFTKFVGIKLLPNTQLEANTEMGDFG